MSPHAERAHYHAKLSALVTIMANRPADQRRCRMSLGGGTYDAYVRIWNSKTPEKVKAIQIKGRADLRTVSSATLNVTLP